MRGQSGLFLMTSFYFLVSLGPVGLFALTLTVQVKNKIVFFLFKKISFQFSSYYEVMRLGYQVTGVENLTGWTWLLFLLGKNDEYFLPQSLIFFLQEIFTFSTRAWPVCWG